MKNVVVAHESYIISQLEIDAFAAIKATVIQTGNLETDDAREKARAADALMVTIQTVDAELINSLERCQIIARVGTGLDAIDIPAATARGIWVTNVADYSIDEVSTHAIALLLNHARRLRKMFASVEAGSWYDANAIEPAPRLKGQILGIIGYGRIGRTVAVKARGLGLEVIVYDPYVDDRGGARPGEAGRPGYLAGQRRFHFAAYAAERLLAAYHQRRLAGKDETQRLSHQYRARRIGRGERAAGGGAERQHRRRRP